MCLIENATLVKLLDEISVSSRSRGDVIRGMTEKLRPEKDRVSPGFDRAKPRSDSAT